MAVRAAALLIAAALAFLLPLTRPAAAHAAAATTNPRAFSCTGSLGEAFTQRTVSGLLTVTHTPYQVRVTQTATGVLDSSRTRRAAQVGPSGLHAGYTEWDITGPNPNGDIFHLHVPPVLPGAGGSFDADLDIQFAGGANGGWQIPIFDCTVTGGPAWMSTPAGVRSFTCTGSLGEAFTQRTVTGRLNRLNVPSAVAVTQTGTGVVDSSRTRKAALAGPSALHAGYTEWDVTGPNPNGDVFHLHVPPVLPGAGGFFDADLDIQFAGGANGGWQIPMFDCAVSAAP